MILCGFIYLAWVGCDYCLIRESRLTGYISCWVIMYDCQFAYLQGILYFHMSLRYIEIGAFVVPFLGLSFCSLFYMFIPVEGNCYI